MVVHEYLIYGAAAVAAVFLCLKAWPYLFFFGGAAAVVFRMSGKAKPLLKAPDDVLTVRDGYVSCYLITTNTGYIAVDAGQHVSGVKASLKKLGVSPEEVTTVLLTHSDADHTGAVSLFRSADVYLAKEEEPLINGTGKRTFTRYKTSFQGNRLPVQHELLNDGDILSIDNRTVQCILTPGHTPGSMCFLVDNRYLFTGDLLELEGGEFQIFVPLFTMDTGESRRSIEKLVKKMQNKPIECVFTGHHGWTDNFRRASEGWFF